MKNCLNTVQKVKICTMLVCTIGFGYLITPMHVSAYDCPPTAGGVCDGIDSGEAGVMDIIVNITGFLMWAVGAAAVVLIIVGGLRYILAAGNDQQVAGAKKMIIGALVGLGIAVMSLAIIGLVRGAF